MVSGTTDVGFVNRNRQKNLRRTDKRSNHDNQFLYLLECGVFGRTYGANGSDIWLRKCPKCQGGAASSEAK